jgi:hypothetical protein
MGNVLPNYDMSNVLPDYELAAGWKNSLCCVHITVKEMQNRTTNWTFDLHVENQLVCSTLNEKYFQRVRSKSKGKKAMMCPQRCKLSKYVFMTLTFRLWPWNSNRVCCYYTEYVY